MLCLPRALYLPKLTVNNQCFLSMQICGISSPETELSPLICKVSNGKNNDWRPLEMTWGLLILQHQW